MFSGASQVGVLAVGVSEREISRANTNSALIARVPCLHASSRPDRKNLDEKKPRCRISLPDGKTRRTTFQESIHRPPRGLVYVAVHSELRLCAGKN